MLEDRENPNNPNVDCCKDNEGDAMDIKVGDRVSVVGTYEVVSVYDNGDVLLGGLGYVPGDKCEALGPGEILVGPDGSSGGGGQ